MEYVLFCVSLFILVFLSFTWRKQSDWIVYAIAFYLPLGGAVNLLKVSFVTFLIFYFLMIHSEKKFTLNKKLIVSSFLFFCLVSFNSILNQSLYEFLVSINFIFSVLFLVVFCKYIISEVVFNRKLIYKSEHIAHAMFLGVVISFLLGLIFGADSVRYSGYGMSPNILAALVLINLSIYFFSGFKFKNIIPVSFLILIGSLTASRLFIFGAIFISFYMFLFVKTFDKNNLIKKTSLFFLLFLVIYQLYDMGYFDLVLDRVLNPKNDDITNNRSYLWLSYLLHFVSEARIFMFGGEMHFRVYQLDGLPQVPHNFLIEPLIAYGVIGTSLSIFMIYQALCRPELRFFLSLPVLVLFLTGMTTHTFVSVDFVLVLLISFIAYHERETRKLV